MILRSHTAEDKDDLAMYATSVDLDGAYPNFLNFRHLACAGNTASPPKMCDSALADNCPAFF